MNAFFSSAKIRNRADATAKKYITALGVWLTFLDRIGRPWWEAIEDDVEEFAFWRLTDPANERRVTGGTVHGNLIAMMVEADVRLLSDGGDPEQDSSWP